MTKPIYARKHLIEALRQSGLPCGYPTILKYEQKGIIKAPATIITYGDRRWRLYTAEELDENIQRVIDYKATPKPRKKSD